MAQPKSFGDRLRELRIAADRSMGFVARALGVTTLNYSAVENGKAPPWPFVEVSYVALARAIGGDVSDLAALAIAANVQANTQPVDEVRLRGAVAFLRREFRDDGAEGESVHRVCADAIALLEQIAVARAEITALQKVIPRPSRGALMVRATAAASDVFNATERLKAIPDTLKNRGARLNASASLVRAKELESEANAELEAAGGRYGTHPKEGVDR